MTPDQSMDETAKAHLRVARPMDNLTDVAQFYRDRLGFEVLYEFNDHDGFDSVMLGHKGAAYHLEFTHQRGHTTGRSRTKDNLFVFYLADEVEWQQAVKGLRAAGIKLSRQFNP
jgi:catechol 2,3-dioxygenase-like lactoylglutathione lyase family enzyme